jgi:hypothetical protein
MSATAYRSPGSLDTSRHDRSEVTSHLVEHATQVASCTEATERAVDRAWSGMALPWGPVLLSGLQPPRHGHDRQSRRPGRESPADR